MIIGRRIFAAISFFVLLIYLTLLAQLSFAGPNSVTVFGPVKIPDFKIPYHAMTKDKEGFVYLAGLTSSDSGVTQNAYDTTYNGGDYDIFIAKLAPQTLKVVALTLLGGAKDEWCRAILIKQDGTVVLTGSTTSPDFLRNNNSPKNQPVKGETIFVAQFDKNLQQLSALNLFGPGEGLALAESNDKSALNVFGPREGLTPAESNDNNLYVAGRLSGPSEFLQGSLVSLDSTYNGGDDAFVAKLDDSLLPSTTTFIGGKGKDVALTMVTDKNGNVIVAGYTDSKDFIDANKSINIGQATESGDGFIAKLTPDLENIQAVIQLGGSSHEVIHDLALAKDESIYVAGVTASQDFPVTSGSYDGSFNGQTDIFVSQISGNLEKVIASTYLGGSKGDGGYSLVIDNNQDIYIAGDSELKDFLGLPASKKEEKEAVGDVIVVKLNRTLTKAEEVFYVGGKLDERVPLLIMGKDNETILAGLTNSKDFPQDAPPFVGQGKERYRLFLIFINVPL